MGQMKNAMKIAATRWRRAQEIGVGFVMCSFCVAAVRLTPAGVPCPATGSETLSLLIGDRAWINPGADHAAERDSQRQPYTCRQSPRSQEANLTAKRKESSHVIKQLL